MIDKDLRNEIHRNFTRPIKKDNIMMPVGGYVVAQFQANNPGNDIMLFLLSHSRRFIVSIVRIWKVSCKDLRCDSSQSAEQKSDF